MDYRYLRAFIYTARFCSFSKAAEKLNIAQSAVSRQIKLLEDSIGVELIVRSSKKVILTKQGKDFYLAAENFDQISQEIFDREDKRELKIGILQGLLKNWFFPILDDYLNHHRRSLTIQVSEPIDLRKGLESGVFDIIFSTENIQSDLISSLKLFNEKLVLISTEKINRKKLSDYRWIVYGDKDYLYQTAGKKISSSIVQVESLKTIVELVTHGHGIAIVPDHILKKDHSLYIEQINMSQKSEIFMSTLNYKSMPIYIREMASIINKHNE